MMKESDEILRSDGGYQSSVVPAIKKHSHSGILKLFEGSFHLL